MSTEAAKPALRQRVAAAILEAAARVLAQRGDLVSMRDVADAAGVARATLYRYFPTREALLEALSEQALDETTERLAAARLDEVDLEVAFSRAVRALVEVGDPLVVLVRGRDTHGQPDFERRVAGPLRALIERAQDVGELRDDVLAAWLLESLLSLVVSVLPSAPTLGAEDAVEAITGVFLDGARGAARREVVAQERQSRTRPTRPPERRRVGGAVAASPGGCAGGAGCAATCCCCRGLLTESGLPA